MAGQPPEQVQVDLSNADIMPEYMSSGIPSNFCQMGQQGIYDLPMKGLVMGGGTHVQTGFQIDLLNSSNA